MTQGIRQSPLRLLLLKLVRSQKAWGSVTRGESHCQISSLVPSLPLPVLAWNFHSCINNQETRILTSLHSLSFSVLKVRAKSTGWRRTLAQTRPSCQGLALGTQRATDAKELHGSDRTMRDRYARPLAPPHPPPREWRPQSQQWPPGGKRVSSPVLDVP